ncbi:MAG TPA: tripartite tricarboxylate transporter TctB family protein, partial [Candidatus Methylomirabilis sp.]|nr:tripartite tricarboxylate transporter TctB family protein [Candidatus Methylomirabilis sp.]
SRPHVAWVSPIVVKMVGAFAVYATLIDLIGYSVPTLLFLLTEFRLLGVKSWKTNIALTALVSIFFYIVFIHYCEMIFPRGTLFE